nr:DNA-directed DNA polymerase [Tanacetum cinerariifolium]
MADQRTMAELLRAPTEGYAEAIVVPQILAEQFELKYSLINMMTSDQFFGLEKDNPHDHICWFNKITSTIKYKDVPNSAIKLMLFPFSLAGAARQWLEKEPRAWDRYKDLLCACPYHGFTELHQLDTFYNALNPADQDSLNAVAGGKLLERRTQDVLTIIENKFKVRNSRNKSVVSQVKSYDANSNSSLEIAKLTHVVNQQTSDMTTAMTATLKQFQATPRPASVKAVEEICVTCGGAHPYYQCLATSGNTFPELKDNIQGYVSAPAVNYNQGNSVYRPPGMANQIRPPGFAQPNVKNNQNRFGQPQGFNRGNNFNPEQSYQALTQQNQIVPLNELEKVKRMNEANMKAMQTQMNIVKNELRNEMKNSIQASLSNQTNEIKNMMASLFQMNAASTLGSGSLPSNTVANPKGELKAITTLSALLSNKEKLQELANTPLNENCSAVILKKLPKKLRDPGKFLIPCGFNELKCKAISDLGASINLMPLSVWKKLGLPEFISTRITLELANRAICTPAGVVRDVFVPVGKFTFPSDFVIVDYESDPRVPLFLGRPFLRTARALIDVHGEEMILRDGDERLTLNMRHDTSSYSNQSQRESINLINVYNNSSEDFLKDLFLTNQPSGNPTFSSHPELTSPEVNYDIFDLEGGNVLPEKLLDLDSTKDLHPSLHVNPLSGSTIYSSSPLLEELADELALITFPLKYDDDLYNLANPADNFVDFMPEMFIDEHAPDYSSPLIFDEYDDDFLEVKSDTENVYDDPFDSKGEKIKESKLLIDELDLPCDFLPSSEYDSFISQDFSRVDAKPSTNNEDKVFNPSIPSQENPFEIITHVVQDKKVAISNASLVLEDFDPLLYEPLFFKEVLRSKMLLLFSSENEEKVFKPGIHTSKKVHSSRIPELSHQGYKIFKTNQIFKSLMKIFLFSCGKDTHILVVPCFHFYPLDQFKYGGIGSS